MSLTLILPILWSEITKSTKVTRKDATSRHSQLGAFLQAKKHDCTNVRASVQSLWRACQVPEMFLLHATNLAKVVEIVHIQWAVRKSVWALSASISWGGMRSPSETAESLASCVLPPLGLTFRRKSETRSSVKTPGTQKPPADGACVSTSGGELRRQLTLTLTAPAWAFQHASCLIQSPWTERQRGNLRPAVQLSPHSPSNYPFAFPPPYDQISEFCCFLTTFGSELMPTFTS